MHLRETHSAVSFSPRAIRAFSPVFDGLWRRSGMRGPLHKLRLVETPPHLAEIWFFSVPWGPLPASGARKAAVCGRDSKTIE
jgi:hypothetical protein